MTTEQLKHLVDLTDKNAHGEALEYIAKQFAYCGKFANILRLVNGICHIEGHLPVGLAYYRYLVGKEMLDYIEKKEGEKVALSIYQCI